MEKLLTLIIVPILIGVIVVVIEYFIIKPFRERKKSSQAISSYQPQGVQSQPSRSSSPEWTTARSRAIEQFKAQKTEYDWFISDFSSSHYKRSPDTVSVEGFRVDKGRGILTIKILTTDMMRAGGIASASGISRPQVAARYELTIDRTGDILEIRSIPKYTAY